MSNTTKVNLKTLKLVNKALVALEPHIGEIWDDGNDGHPSCPALDMFIELARGTVNLARQLHTSQPALQLALERLAEEALETCQAD